ncbi:MAG TPA: hypothetical protein VLB09_07725 [Nitrospiria bacterium]|nr:hypothetical protein [Nitrospiria bacterium]
MADPLTFSTEELSVIQDTRLFKIKADVTPKIQNLLHQLQAVYSEELSRSSLLMPEGVDTHKGQFVKGEHLLDFPYLYLDFPKLFTTEEKFAFRSLFWWGHYWVFAWILEGGHMRQYKDNLIGAYDQLSGRGLHLLMTDTPWEWRKDPEFSLEIRKDNRDQITAAIQARPFLKIHRYVDFENPAFVKGDIAREAAEIFRLMTVIVAE